MSGSNSSGGDDSDSAAERTVPQPCGGGNDDDDEWLLAAAATAQGRRDFVRGGGIERTVAELNAASADSAAAAVRCAALRTFAALRPFSRRLAKARVMSGVGGTGGSYRAQLAIEVTQDHFGDVPKAVVAFLLTRGPQTLGDLRRFASQQLQPPVPGDLFARILATLLQHGLVEATTSGKRPAYRALPDAIVRRVRFAALIERARSALGDDAATALTVLIEHGIADTDRVVGTACDIRASERRLDGGGGGLSSDADADESARERDTALFRRALRALVKAHYVVRASQPSLNADGFLAAAAAAPQPELQPTMDASSSSRKKRATREESSEDKGSSRSKRRKKKEGAAAPEESAADAAMLFAAGDDASASAAAAADELPPELQVLMGRIPSEDAALRAQQQAAAAAARQQQQRAEEGLFQGELEIPTAESIAAAAAADGIGGADEDVNDGSVLWRLNYAQFLREEREKAVLALVGEKINPTAEQIVRVMLRETNGGAHGISASDLLDRLHRSGVPELVRLDMPRLRNYLEICHKDKAQIISKRIGPQHTEVFAVQVPVVVAGIRQKLVESVVLDKLGPKGLRVFRLLLIKHMLEAKQVAELAMISSREARELLLLLQAQGYIFLQEFPKTSGPNRDSKTSIFLWGARLEDALKLVCDDVDHAILNARVRLADEVEKNKQFVDKCEEREASPDGDKLTEDERVRLDQFLLLQERLEGTQHRLATMATVLREF